MNPFIKICLIFLLCSLLNTTSAQNDSVILVSDSLLDINGDILLLKNGQQLQIQTDSSYLFSSDQHFLYEKARAYILNSDNAAENALIKAYEATLARKDTNYQKIIAQNEKMREGMKSVIKVSKNKLSIMKEELEQSQIKLAEAENNFDQLRQDLKKSNKPKTSKWLWFGGGIVAGAVVGVLL